MLPGYITFINRPVYEEAAQDGCGFKNVTGGMVGSRTLISLTKKRRTKTHSHFFEREREGSGVGSGEGMRLMVTAKPGAVVSRNNPPPLLAVELPLSHFAPA